MKIKRKKIHATKAYKNGVKLNYVPSLVALSKIFDRSILGIATWNSPVKIKSAIPREPNYVGWFIKNSKQFSVNSRGKFIYQYQASRRANTGPLVFLFQIFIYFPVFYVVILVEHPALFILGKCLMDSYWSLALHLSCFPV